MKKHILFLLAVFFLLTSPANANTEDWKSGYNSLAPNEVGSELRISQTETTESRRDHPRLAYNPDKDEYLVVWENLWPGGSRDVYARRVTGSGELKSQFTVATGAKTDNKNRFSPDAAYNGTSDEYLVVYMFDAKGDSMQYEVWGRRVAWNGSWLGPEFQIFSWPNRGFYGPRVVWNSWRDEYFVVANALDTQTGKWNDVAGRRVSIDGSTPYPGHSISAQNQSLQPCQADVAYNPQVDEYLVVWQQLYGATDWDIHGARVGGLDYAVINPPGVIMIDNAPVAQKSPAVSHNQKDRYMVVWEHDESKGIYGRQLNNTGGTVGDKYPISSTSLNISRKFPSVVLLNNGARSTVWWDSNGQKIILNETIWGGDIALDWFAEIASDTTQIPPALEAGNAGNKDYLVVYGRNEGTGVHLYGKIVSTGGIYFDFPGKYLPVIIR